MSADSAAAPERQSAGSGKERRVAVRYPFGRQVDCSAVSAGTGCPAVVQDISTSGIGLVCNHQFDPGRLLSVEMQSPDDLLLYVFPTRVMRSTSQPNGEWLIGCTFLSPLRPELLQELLKG